MGSSEGAGETCLYPPDVGPLMHTEDVCQGGEPVLLIPLYVPKLCRPQNTILCKIAATLASCRWPGI